MLTENENGHFKKSPDYFLLSQSPSVRGHPPLDPAGKRKDRPSPFPSNPFSLPAGLGRGESGTEQTIILSIRFPRVLLAGLVGAGLSVSGTVFQALLRNPLADPYILGVSSGAAVGAIIAILTGLGTFSLRHSPGLFPWSASRPFSRSSISEGRKERSIPTPSSLQGSSRAPFSLRSSCFLSPSPRGRSSAPSSSG